MSTLFGKSKKRARPKETTALAPTIQDENATNHDEITTLTTSSTSTKPQHHYDFASLGLGSPLVAACRQIGFKKPTPIQRQVIPAVLKGDHVLALAPTGSGKTAAFALPILHKLSLDPYGIYCIILSPTRELALQIHEQILALGSSTLKIKSTLVTGGMDQVRQSCQLHQIQPHFVVATPGRLEYLLRGTNPPIVRNVRFVVLDEADRLLSPGGFERDVAEVLLATSRSKKCQTLLFSATMTKSLSVVEELVGAGRGRLPLVKIAVEDEFSAHSPNDGDEKDGGVISTPRIPSGLKHEYIFMPSRVRDAYAVTAIRALMQNSGRRGSHHQHKNMGSGWNISNNLGSDSDDDEEDGPKKAKSCIIFVSTCEKAARMEGMLHQLGMDCTALHGLLTQDRRMASLMKFKSQQVRMLVATDVASRGLDIPQVDLVLNVELPRNAEDYIHRVGRTARAGRRGLAVSLVGERDVALVHAAEELSGRKMEQCKMVTEEEAVKVLGSVTKAVRLTNMKLMEVGFDDLVKKRLERRAKDRKERYRAKKMAAKSVMKGGT